MDSETAPVWTAVLGRGFEGLKSPGDDIGVLLAVLCGKLAGVGGMMA